MQKIAFIKRCGLLVVLLCLVWPCAAQTQTQSEPTVTIQRSNITVEQLFKEVEKQTDLTFVYKTGDFDATRVVAVDVTRRPVTELLRTVLPQCDSRINGKRILITRRNASSVSAVAESVASRIAGRVTDEKQQPVIGATVLFYNGSQPRGTTTDSEGRFTFVDVASLQSDARIEVSFLGYKTSVKRCDNTAQTDFTITLESDVQSIDDVVVVGYGVQKKANLTGAVATISSEKLKDRPGSNIGQALQGAVPNLNITFGSGQPGAAATYNVRGNTSPNGGSPLILIDGVETYPDRINSNDIESVTVLKDAASAAIYGARGAYGVILITTKSGHRQEQAEVSYNGYFSVSSPTTSTDYETRGYYSARIADFFLTATSGTPYTTYTQADYKALWDRRNDRTENPERPWVITEQRNGRNSYVYLANFDWYNYLYDDSRPTWDHNINIRGGTEKLSYMVSGRYYKQQGVNRVQPDNFRSYNFRVKLSAEIKPWLTLTSNTKFFSSKYTYYGTDSETNNYRMPSLHALASFVPVNPDGTAVSHTSMTNSDTHYVADGYNALLLKGKSGGHNKTQEMSTTFGMDFKLHKTFSIKTDFSYTLGYLRKDYRGVEIEYSKYPGVIESEKSSKSPEGYSETVWDQNYYVADVYGNYDNTFGDGHHLSGVVGYNYEAKYYKDLKAGRNGMLSEDLSDFNLATGTMSLTGGQNEYAIMGWFYRVAYDYKGRYLVEADGRYDGTSRFPRGKRYGFFPSFSAAYNISEESFFEPLRKTVDNLKIRLSYGSLGNQQIGYYDFMQEINTSGTMNYTFDGSSLAGHATIGDPVSGNQTWEKVISKNLGLDLAMFNNRLQFSSDFYIRDTKGILTSGQPLPSIYGAAEPQINANDLRTKGYELSLQWRDRFTLFNRPFHYGVTLIFSDYTAEYTKCQNQTGQIDQPYVGKKLGEIWGYRISGLFRTDEEAAAYIAEHDMKLVMPKVYTSTGAYGKGVRAGDPCYVNLDDDPVISRGNDTLDDHGDREVIGNTTPRYHYGATLSFDYCGFDVSVFVQGIGKQNWYPGSDNMRFWGPYCRPYATFIPSDIMSRAWSETNPDGYLPRARAYACRDGYSVFYTNDRYMQDLAYCRLKNLTVGYTIPLRVTKKAGIKQLRVYFSGENLATWSRLKCDYIDPEQASADSDKNSNTYPWCKTYSFGVNLTF